MTHELKITPVFFNHVITGNKTFEIRKNDRNFRKGDFIVLREFSGMRQLSDSSGYTGRCFTAVITYLTNYEQKEGCVVFSFKPTLESKMKITLNRVKSLLRKRSA